MKKEVLKKLLLACSPSGDENDAVMTWNEEMKKLNGGIKHYYQDKMGNSGWAGKWKNKNPNLRTYRRNLYGSEIYRR